MITSTVLPVHWVPESGVEYLAEIMNASTEAVAKAYQEMMANQSTSNSRRRRSHSTTRKRPSH